MGWRRERRNFRSSDPGFNRAEVEDRATVMFWRKAMADRLGKVDPLRKMALDEFCASYAGVLSPQPDGSRAYIGDCAVGGAASAGIDSRRNGGFGGFGVGVGRGTNDRRGRGGRSENRAAHPNAQPLCLET